jgi:hydrogenase expression/formation protein HypC
MQIVEIGDDTTGIVNAEGARRRIDLSLLDSPRCGEYVIVHAGFAIERLDEQDAAERLALFAELARAAEGET